MLFQSNQKSDSIEFLDCFLTTVRRLMIKKILGCIVALIMVTGLIASVSFSQLPGQPGGGGPSTVYTIEFYSHHQSFTAIPPNYCAYNHIIDVCATYSGLPSGSIAYLCSLPQDLVMNGQTTDYKNLDGDYKTTASGKLRSYTNFGQEYNGADYFSFFNSIFVDGYFSGGTNQSSFTTHEMLPYYSAQAPAGSWIWQRSGGTSNIVYDDDDSSVVEFTNMCLLHNYAYHGKHATFYFEQKQPDNSWERTIATSYTSNGQECNYYDSNYEMISNKEMWFRKLPVILFDDYQRSAGAWLVRWVLVNEQDDTYFAYFPNETGMWLYDPN